MKLWEEISGDYPAFEFEHSYGLGMICVGAAAIAHPIECLVQNRFTGRWAKISRILKRLGASLVTEQSYAALTTEMNVLSQQLNASRNHAHQLYLADLANNRAIAAIDSVIASYELKIVSLQKSNEELTSKLAAAVKPQADENVVRAEPVFLTDPSNSSDFNTNLSATHPSALLDQQMSHRNPLRI